MVIHVVRPGDSLYRIAQEHNLSVQYLVQQNELRDSNRLTVGQTIVVPQPKQTYTVQRGDTLERVAAQTNTPIITLWQNNPQLMGLERIYPGQTLVLSFQQPKIGKLAVNGYAYPSIDMRILRRTLPYLTYLSVFSYGFDANGRLLSQNDEMLVRLARQYQVKPILVLTTLGENGQFSGERAHELFQNELTRTTLLEALEQTVEKHGFAGVDIDFEYIPAEDADAYVDFVKDVRDRLEPKDVTVMVALAPKTSADQPGLLYEAHDYKELGEAADDVLLMTYE